MLAKALLWPVNGFFLIEFTKAFSQWILYWHFCCCCCLCQGSLHSYCLLAYASFFRNKHFISSLFFYCVIYILLSYLIVYRDKQKINVRWDCIFWLQNRLCFSFLACFPFLAFSIKRSNLIQVAFLLCRNWQSACNKWKKQTFVLKVL